LWLLFSQGALDQGIGQFIVLTKLSLDMDFTRAHEVEPRLFSQGALDQGIGQFVQVQKPTATSPYEVRIYYIFPSYRAHEVEPRYGLYGR
jgi:hypothetical protein